MSNLGFQLVSKVPRGVCAFYTGCLESIFLFSRFLDDSHHSDSSEIEFQISSDLHFPAGNHIFNYLLATRICSSEWPLSSTALQTALALTEGL